MASELVGFIGDQWHSYDIDNPKLIAFLVAVATDSSPFTELEYHKLVKSDFMFDLEHNLSDLAYAYTLFMSCSDFKSDDLLTIFLGNLAISFNLVKSNCDEAFLVAKRILLNLDLNYKPLDGDFPLKDALGFIVNDVKSYLQDLTLDFATSTFDDMRLAASNSVESFCLICYLKLLHLIILVFYDTSTIRKELNIIVNNKKSNSCLDAELVANLLVYIESVDGGLDNEFVDYIIDKFNSFDNSRRSISEISDELSDRATEITNYINSLSPDDVVPGGISTFTSNLNNHLVPLDISFSEDEIRAIVEDHLSRDGDWVVNNILSNLSKNSQTTLNARACKINVDELLKTCAIFECR